MKHSRNLRRIAHPFDIAALREMQAICQAIRRCDQIQWAEGNALIVLPANSSGSSATQFKITSIPAGKKDYFMAKTWDGTALGSTEVAIAKRFEQRPSVTTVTILGTAFTYVYSNDNHRTDSDGSTTQNEELYTPFEVDAGHTNGICVAVKLSAHTGVVDGSGQPIDWLDITPRVWAKY